MSDLFGQGVRNPKAGVIFSAHCVSKELNRTRHNHAAVGLGRNSTGEDHS